MLSCFCACIVLYMDELWNQEKKKKKTQSNFIFRSWMLTRDGKTKDVKKEKCRGGEAWSELVPLWSGRVLEILCDEHPSSE